MGTRARDEDWDNDFDDGPRRREETSQSGTLIVIFGMVAVIALVAIGGTAALAIFMMRSAPRTAPVAAQAPAPAPMPFPPNQKGSPPAGRPSTPDNLQIGKEAPEIEGEDIDGKRFKLSDYKGKVVVLDFWGNW
jgi:hypothetical protein